MELLPAILLTLLAVVGAAVGVVVALSNAQARDQKTARAEPGLLRVTADVHTGWEQTLLGLHRELGLPRRAEDVPYAGLYLEPLHERQLLIRSRSEIGRGFLGITDITPGRGRTAVTYRILRLPGDERVRESVLGLELQLVRALRRIDRTVSVQLAGGPLREAALEHTAIPPETEQRQ